MFRLYLLLTLFLICFPRGINAQHERSDSLLKVTLKQYGQAFVTMNIPGDSLTELISRHVSVSGADSKKLKICLSPRTAGWFVNQRFSYSVDQPVETKGISIASDMRQAMNWNKYPTLEQYDSIMNYLPEKYHGLCSLDTIGTSVLGRQIYAIRITSELKGNKPHVLFTSSVHGNETAGFILMLRLADYLLGNYETDPWVRKLVDNLEIWINPLANPDGTYRDGNTINNPVRFNAEGYDLNRNFPDPEAPEIVPVKETQDMIAFMKKNRFVLSANFHSGEEVVNYPWDRWERLHADDYWFHMVSRNYADTVHKTSSGDYMTGFDNGITNGYKWYSVYGGRQDYVTYSLQGREVTIELDREYVTPADKLDLIWDYNRKSLLDYLNNALNGIHGDVTDAMTGNPVAAVIFISGHDRDSSMVFSDAGTGSYSRLIGSGKWYLSASAGGYFSTSKSAVVVDGEQTILNFRLRLINDPADTTDTGKIFLYPNPASADVAVSLPSEFNGPVRLMISASSGSIVLDRKYSVVSGFPFSLTVGHLAPGVYNVNAISLSGGLIATGRLIVVKN